MPPEEPAGESPVTAGESPEPAGDSAETAAAPQMPPPGTVVTPEELDISGLPPLQYPGGGRDPSFEKWAEERRHRRLRTEIVGGGALLLIGVVAGLLMRSPQVVAFAVLAAIGIAVYEFLVNSFE